MTALTERLRAVEVPLSPDGVRYTIDGPKPAPFHLRWLVPALCQRNGSRWIVCAWLSAFLACAGTMLLARQHGIGWWPCVAAGLFVAGLPATRFQLSRPVLVDLPALAAAVWAAVVFDWNPVAGIVLAVLAGCVRESAPVWAGLYAWNPLLLLGLVAPAIRQVTASTGADVLKDGDAWILAHPFKASLFEHRDKWRDPLVMVAPWGGLLAALWLPSPWLLVTVAVAYGQLLIATDTVRLYQQAAPVAAVVTVGHVEWLWPLLIVTWLNPFAGDGI